MRKLEPKDLEPGMVTAKIIKTPLGQILANEGDEVTRPLINRMKLYKVDYAWVMGEAPLPEIAPKSPVVSQAPVAQPVVSSGAETHAQKSKTHSQKVAASPEFRDFQMGYFTAIEKLKEVFATAERGEQINSTSLLNSVGDLFRSRNTIVELFDMLFNMRIVEDAIYAHCLNVGLVSRMIGRWLKLGTAELNVLTLAGLLHDIGKIKIPPEVLNKPGKLTDDEFSLIQQHPQLGFELLKTQKINSHIKKTALMHHERCDGTGYPNKLNKDSIDNYAMIVGIADVYDAMTAARSYRAPLCPFQVISNFEEEGYQKYNTKYILTFLKQIAATYQNNRVILSDGRGCNIVMLNPNALSRPMVQLDDNSVIDLSSQREIYIKSVL